MPSVETSALPSVDFCGLNVSRLIIGANPYGGYSHQTSERDQAMVSYYTPERIIETWERAEAAGINTMITNNETPHVMEATRQYLSSGGRLQWIAQLNNRGFARMEDAVDAAVEVGARGVYFHGGIIDGLFAQRDESTLRSWVRHVQSCGLPAAVAAHAPAAHDWVDSLDLVDFHVVCFFNCGSLHDGEGHMFRLADVPAATACIQRLTKPCIGYKIMGSGRLDPTMALEHAFESIKPGDVVNVGMHRGDHDDMVEVNAAIVRQVLGRETEESQAVLRTAAQWS
jgi:hypothetical protein